MIQSIARLAIAERHRHDALRTLRVLRGHTTAKAGCVAFQVTQDLADPAVLTIIERWATRADLDAHIRSSDYKLLLAVIELAVRPPEIRFDVLEPVGGLDIVWAVRSVQQVDAAMVVHRPKE
jgi:quinol monooxygenase YgiN